MRLSLYRLNISEVRQILLELEKHLNKHQKEVLDDLVKLYVYHHNVTEKKKNQKKEVLDDLVKLLIKSNVINKERK